MKKVYMSFSTDVIHAGHIRIIHKAASLGALTIGVLTDEVVASYKRFPLLSTQNRVEILRGISGVSEVVVQDSLVGEAQLRALCPDYVVHGDDWRTGAQKPARDKISQLLHEWGGELVEYPYTENAEFEALEKQVQSQLSIPDIRRGRLKKLLNLKKLITAIEVHNGLTGLLAENTTIAKNGSVHQFDAMWLSSLSDSTAKGKPDIELVDYSSRLRTIDDVLEVTTKPIIFDADTGGFVEHFVYLVRTLERIGVSAMIVEDKTGLKRNSLFGDEVAQTQDSIVHFQEKLAAGKQALKTKDFMIIARVESLILNAGMDDALMRAEAYVQAGADGIMIHSRKKQPDEIFEFCRLFRDKDSATPIVVVPSTFSSVTEKEFENRGVNIVIYANQMIRSAFPAMQKVALSILEHGRAEEADEICLPIKEIIRLIPE